MHPRRPRQALPPVPVCPPQICRLGLGLLRVPRGETPLLRWPPLRMVRRWDQFHRSPWMGGVPPTAERRLPNLVGARQLPLPKGKRLELVQPEHRRRARAVAGAGNPDGGGMRPLRLPRHPRQALPHAAASRICRLWLPLQAPA